MTELEKQQHYDDFEQLSYFFETLKKLRFQSVEWWMWYYDEQFIGLDEFKAEEFLDHIRSSTDTKQQYGEEN